MATNKRKEAAALFELIDKSTLKVPKHAGALKIPEWWSSKTNPTAIAPPAPSPLPVPSTPPPTVAPASTVSPVVAPTQSRLFEPPAVGDAPAVSPSIRPPAVHPPAPAAVSSSPAATVREPRVQVGAVSSEAAPAVRRQFLPQTAAQGPDMKPQWGGQQRRRMARTPKWAVLAGALGVVIAGALIVYLALAGRRHWGSKMSEPAVVVSGGGQVPSESGTPLLPPVGGGGGVTLPSSPMPGSSQRFPPSSPQPDGGTSPDGEATQEVQEGKVYGPGVIKHSPELYYLMISSTPTASVAQKNAEFLAKHGVDVSIEIVGSANGKTRWYKLISVEGFSTLVDAEPFRKKIVAIGHLTPDFRKYHKVWDDAFPAHVSSAGK